MSALEEFAKGLYTPDLKDLSALTGSTEQQAAALWERQAVRELVDTALYGRDETRWYRAAVLEGFCFFYDTSVYDRRTGRYSIEAFLEDAEREFGSFDTIILWQPYPRIGIDQRNQFDFWRDMPGGLDGVRDVVARAHARGVRCLVNYIPWDGHTRREEKPDEQAMAEVVRATGADGIYGDTMRGFPHAFADSLAAVGPDRVLESEAEPSLRQVQWQAGRWVQTPKPEPTLAPLVRWIEPRFACFTTNRHQRERARLIAWSFFFGMGFVVWENVFGWWNPFSTEDRTLLRRVAALLRANRDAFCDRDWRPLDVSLPTGVHANVWSAPGKTVVTLLNVTDRALPSVVVPLPRQEGATWYDAWNGTDLDLRLVDGGDWTEARVAIDPGSAGCLVASFAGAPAGPASTKVWSEAAEAPLRRPVTAADCRPRPVDPTATVDTPNVPEGMVLVAGGQFDFAPCHSWPYDEGGCYDHPGDYGNGHDARTVVLPQILMDRTEVTNGEYHTFLVDTGYRPPEVRNFLRHWERPLGQDSDPRAWRPPIDKENHPVVWVDLDDARAFARWAGKRLPTEEEWQYAAQGLDGRTWPWGEEGQEGWCNGDSADTTAVNAYLHSASPWGCLDMAGNVWEWTESERDDGHTRYAILKSGSNWRLPPEASMWYVASGAQPCAAHQKMLLMYPGLDRCATVGFRCVRDL